MPLMKLLGLWRKLPVPVRDLVVSTVEAILQSDDSEDAAKRALAAARTKAADEFLKRRFPR